MIKEVDKQTLWSVMLITLSRHATMRQSVVINGLAPLRVDSHRYVFI